MPEVESSRGGARRVQPFVLGVVLVALLATGLASSLWVVLLLAGGLYGFNPGSELAADAAIGGIAVTTTAAGAIGALAAMFTVWMRTGKPDVVIGAVAGVLVVFSIDFFEGFGSFVPAGAGGTTSSASVDAADVRESVLD